MALVIAASPETFSAAHIALTAGITGVLALAVAVWRLPRSAWPDIAAVAVLSAALGVPVADLREHDATQHGRPAGFSANDWAAPVLTYLFLSLYADVRLPAEPRRYAQTRALATLISLAVNVITI